MFQLDLWWNNVDNIMRGNLITDLREILSNHKHYSGLNNWSVELFVRGWSLKQALR